jgi:hypothetical protein
MPGLVDDQWSRTEQYGQRHGDHDHEAELQRSRAEHQDEHVGDEDPERDAQGQLDRAAAPARRR